MSKLDWGPYRAIGGVAAFLILAFSAFGWSYLREYQREHAQERHEAAADKNEDGREQRQSTCVDVAKRLSIPCVADAPKSEDGEKYTEYDLRAQQDMAEWAYVMAFLSGLGVFVTSVATVYVALTLHETRRMAGQSELSTKAAVDAARAAEDTANAMIAIESPMVRPVSMYATSEQIETDLGHGRRAVTAYRFNINDVRFQNYGKTPAFPKSINFTFEIGDELPDEPAYAQTNFFDPDAVIMPNMIDPFRATMVWVGGRNETTEESLDALRGHTTNARFYCTIRYEDAFGATHESACCWAWNGKFGKYCFRIDPMAPAAYFKRT